MTRVHDDAGITLVEVMVSLAILAIVLTAFASVISSGMQSLSESRARQTASQVSTEAIEELRNVSPPLIRMDSDVVDLAATSNCTTATSALGFDPDGAGPLGCEELAASTSGAITSVGPYAGTVDAVDFVTVSTFANDPDMPAGTVRVVVESSYELPAGSETIRRQALFSEVPRG